MRQAFLTLKQTVYKTMVLVGLVSLIYTSGFFVAEQPSYADILKQPVKEQPFVLDEPKTATNREAAYEEAIDTAKKSNGVEKEYEKDLETFKEEHPSDNPVVEGAKGLIEKVTGKE